MARAKTSQAKIYPARLNPANELEAKAIEIINYWADRGVNFKQLIVDNILRCEGITPEMFSQQSGAFLFDRFEGMLNQFAGELLEKIQVKGSRIAVESDEDERVATSRFAKNFTRSFVQRQQAVQGDE